MSKTMEIDRKKNDKEVTELYYYLETKDESYLYHRLRHDDITVPAYLKVVDRHDNDLFLKQLYKAQDPWKFEDRMENVDLIVQSAVASILLDLDCTWKFLQGHCESANDIGTFDSAIKTAAKLVYMLYTKKSLYRIGCRHEKNRQMKLLCQRLAILQREGVSLFDAYKEVVELVTDEKKYYLVTENDISDLLHEYKHGSCQQCSRYDEDDVEIEKEGLLNYIDNVVRTQPVPSKSEDDQDTRFMIKLLRGAHIEEEHDLVDKLLAEFNVTLTPATEYMTDLLLWLTVNYRSLIETARRDMNRQLLNVIQGVRLLYKGSGIYVPSRVFEMVQVAELRRMVLGSRFIGQSHLIWAFYECGYGLPPLLKTVMLNSADEDRPCYLIYLVAMKLAKHLGQGTMLLEHLVFAVLYSKNDIGEDIPNQFLQFVRESERSFNEYCNPNKKMRID